MLGIRRRAAGQGPGDLRAGGLEVPGSALPHYRRLVSRLLAVPGQVGSVALTGAGRGVGVTTLAVRTGLLLADENNLDVVLVDANFEAPALGALVGEEGAAGLAEVASGTLALKDALRKTDRPNLFVLPAGTTRPRVVSLVRDDAFDHCLAALQREFQVVVFDTGPVALAPETRVIVGKADAVALVVRARHTPRDDVADALAALAPVQSRLLGLVLNRARHGLGRPR